MGILKLKNYILLVSIVLLMYACSPTKRILVEFPQKPKHEVPQNIQSLLIVNRTVDDKYKDLPTDSLQKIFYQNHFNLDTIIYDLTAVDTTLKALGELLFESGRYDYVIPENRFLKSEKNSFFTPSMNWMEVQELCELYETDAILSMDLFKTRIATQLKEESIYDPENGFFRSAVYAKMVVVYDALFRIYDPLHEKVVVREVFQDTLFWEDYARDVGELFFDFTPVKQALAEAGITLALDLSETVSTGWRSEYRIIFDKGSAALKEAAALTNTPDWTQAIEVWKTIVKKSKSDNEKSKALFNLATACEISGDIDCAIQYALDSYNTSYHAITYHYLIHLENKKKQKNKTK